MKRSQAFTLIELLVVIAIIAILASILFPVFAQAKVAAKKTSSISNLKQVGLALELYHNDSEGYPTMSSPSNTNPRTRWPDYIFPYIKSEAIFVAPNADLKVYGKAWAHNQNLFYGGYGYNYQYLGNSRTVSGNSNFPFTSNDSAFAFPSQTISITDTGGVVNDNNQITAGEYTIDPPLTSARGSGKTSGYYGAGSECATTPTGCRSTPAERHAKKTIVLFLDTHAKALKLDQIDDFNGDGITDNGFWNGQADPLSL